ncbi:hypothetical protein SPRG_14813 [Saprolegnia parasitica CBS 223.65]|uniref:Uncharacterized protein n=1 Tax=Saprolegnia parasitica (strain CBS 223.65) TaxID=695850 RepID=A0A067BXC4_SAPPC|nr:hypothetical protein SPRG_14813 [Saprolegnia parasitica CBS 223.65]KDO18976.1 hypothetical protein SPRG_14813 [Saprolegnia parasitica CBS 223.65]|eukprot:XP_012210324.1 hypothetical protein SPRG_14813 [Saprolegnia parasitica CBS 223.65]
MNRTLSRSNSSPSVNYLQRKSSVTTTTPTAKASSAGLANFAKLTCSMSYKNRTSMFVEGSARDSVSQVELRPTEDKYMRMSTASTYCSSRDSNASSLSTMVSTRMTSEKVVARPSVALPITTIVENPDATDAEIKKMQTKRALRRMCLEMNLTEADEDSDAKVTSDDDDADSDDELAKKLLQLQRVDDSDDDDDDMMLAAAAYKKTKDYQPSDTVTISKAELRQFQTRLKQLEELCADQAEKQAALEMSIEREVRTRTRHLEAQVQEKIEELTLMRELDMDKEIERRFTDFSLATGLSKESDRKTKSKAKKSFFHRPSTLASSGNSELEQFREFLMNNSKRMSERLRETAQFNGDLPPAHNADAYYEASQNELIEMLEKLRTVAYDQDEQLEQAKYLISVAIAKIEAADEVVNEAFEELGKMDSRLDRASQEVQELRRSTMNLSMLSSSSAGSRTPSIHYQPPPQPHFAMASGATRR